MTTVAWVLDLDAELELLDPAGFAPSAALQGKVRRLGDAFLADARVRAEPGVRHVRADAPEAADLCQAWCPTPRAHAAARAAGRELPPSPDLPVLQRVNHRRFLAELAPSLPGARFVTRLDALDELLAAEPPVGDGWLLKRAFGFAGRGRKRVRGALRGPDRRWAEASLADGLGLQVEPFVAITAEFALHGVVGARRCLVGEPTAQVCGADGAWLRSEPAGDRLRAGEREALLDAFDRAAAAARAAGYRGPLGLDAFRFVGPGGDTFQPASDLNARYTMGFFCGFAGRQQEVFRHLREG